MSQEQLSEIAGMDRKTISRIEGGVYSPALDRVFLIADALGAEPVDLFDWHDADPSSVSDTYVSDAGGAYSQGHDAAQS